ncbi:MAG TPA: YceD family protein [Steroidobacteraceae bacterium]
MSPPWVSPLAVDRLADAEAEVEFAIALAELPRLRSRVPSVGGQARGLVRFTREAGYAVAEVSLEGAAILACQRCLANMTEPLRGSTTRVALIAAEADAAAVPEHLDPVLAAGGHISVGEIVEEELLLALPIVPLHARESDCSPVPQAQVLARARDEPSTQRPFEQLAELLKGKQ